ncbi:MAG: dienelactone hydrolase family protein [Planctomycetota bacterium]|nr:dienelactone hydrolase family protein [Planctomycetota bacterium]
MLRAIFTSWAFLAVASLATATDYSLPGPRSAGYTTVTVTRANNTTFTARFFYPALTTGSGAAFDATGAPYPAITFGHGFLQAPSAYQGTLQHLATWGYFIIASESQGSFAPSHQGLADDMRTTLDWLSAQNANASSPYFGRVDVNAYGMSGHSMGAGCSILAAAVDPRVKALANMAAAETSPSAIGAIANVNCPVMLLSGSQDGTVPVATNGQLMYAAAHAPRQLPVITGGYHCGFVDTPSFGGLGCDSGSIPKAIQLAIARRKLTSFFETYLHRNASAWGQTWGEGVQTDSAVLTTLDAGCRVRIANSRVGASAGSTVEVRGAIENTDNAPDGYTLFAEGVSWPMTFGSTVTPTAATGESVPFILRVTIPAGTVSGISRIVVSARRNSDVGTRAFGECGVKVR